MSVPVLSWLFSTLEKCVKLNKSNNSRSKYCDKNCPTASSDYPWGLSKLKRRLLKHATKTSRSNPQSQSFSQSYGSILPTSLIYIVLSTRGCSPWRPDAVMSTTKCVNKSRLRIFKDRWERTGHTKGRYALPCHHPYRRVIRFQGQINVKKKRQLFPGFSLVSPNLFVLPHSIHVLVREY